MKNKIVLNESQLEFIKTHFDFITTEDNRKFYNLSYLIEEIDNEYFLESLNCTNSITGC